MLTVCEWRYTLENQSVKIYQEFYSNAVRFFVFIHVWNLGKTTFSKIQTGIGGLMNFLYTIRTGNN